MHRPSEPEILRLDDTRQGKSGTCNCACKSTTNAKDDAPPADKNAAFMSTYIEMSGS